MRDHGPENPTLRYPRPIDERLSQLETVANRGVETAAARSVGLEGWLIAIEGRLGPLEAWSAEASGRLDLVGHEP